MSTPKPQEFQTVELAQAALQAQALENNRLGARITKCESNIEQLAKVADRRTEIQVGLDENLGRTLTEHTESLGIHAQRMDVLSERITTVSGNSDYAHSRLDDAHSRINYLRDTQAEGDQEARRLIDNLDARISNVSEFVTNRTQEHDNRIRHTQNGLAATVVRLDAQEGRLDIHEERIEHETRRITDQGLNHERLSQTVSEHTERIDNLAAIVVSEHSDHIDAIDGRVTALESLLESSDTMHSGDVDRRIDEHEERIDGHDRRLDSAFRCIDMINETTGDMKEALKAREQGAVNLTNHTFRHDADIAELQTRITSLDDACNQQALTIQSLQAELRSQGLALQAAVAAITTIAGRV